MSKYEGLEPTKIIVAGSRNFTDKDFIFKKLYELLLSDYSNIEIVSGMGKGPDLIGKEWAEENGLKVKKFYPKWKDLKVKNKLIKTGQYGPYNALAGINRNEAMGKYADILIAFWDGVSRGTSHMIDFMDKLNKTSIIINV